MSTKASKTHERHVRRNASTEEQNAEASSAPMRKTRHSSKNNEEKT